MTIFKLQKKLRHQPKVVQATIESNCLLIWYEGNNFIKVCVDPSGTIRDTTTRQAMTLAQLKEQLS